MLSSIARFFGRVFYRNNNNNENYNTDTSNFQNKRTHDLIPGWNGRKFGEDPDGNANILADFRKVPTVWSQMTAEDPTDERSKPLPPEVSIYVKQPKTGVDEAADGSDTGHTGIGIEYTRFSKTTGRFERYNLRFGFYPADLNTSATLMNQYTGALTTGELRDDSDQKYSISRKFKANSKQVNDILKAARKYPNGGYNAWTRNCTTFVKDMLAEGNIHGAEENQVIHYETADLSNAQNLGIMSAMKNLPQAKSDQERNFQSLSQEDDLSYAGWGNKRATKEDYDLYSRSRENDGIINDNILTMLPNGAAENLRRLKHNNAGDFGSYDLLPGFQRGQNAGGSAFWLSVEDACNDAASSIISEAEAIMPADSRLEENDRDIEYAAAIRKIRGTKAMIRY